VLLEEFYLLRIQQAQSVVVEQIRRLDFELIGECLILEDAILQLLRLGWRELM